MQVWCKRSGLDPCMGRSPGGGHGNPLLYSCLENLMDRGAWRAVVLGSHRVGHDRSYLASSRHEHPKCTECYTSVVFLSFFFFFNSYSFKRSLGLPWWLSGKESICQCRRHGFDPLSGKIPHAWEQLSPWVATVEWACALEPKSRNYWAHVLQLLKPVCPKAQALQEEKPPQWEACTLLLESSPCLLQLEKSPCSQK